MWVKIVAGVVAALAVVGIGVYVAMPSDGGCGSHKCNAPAPQGECCSVAELPPADSSEGSCCSGCCRAGGTKVDADAVAACGGGLTAVPVAKSNTKGVACCTD